MAKILSRAGSRPGPLDPGKRPGPEGHYAQPLTISQILDRKVLRQRSSPTLLPLLFQLQRAHHTALT